MKNQIIKTINTVIAAVMALLGFSCANNQDDMKMLMYGTPNATYKVTVKATDITTQAPIRGLKVKVGTSDTNELRMPEVDSVKTALDGKATLTSSAFPLKNLIVEVTDIDSTQNGTYQPHREVIELKSSDYQNGSGIFYKGEVTKEIAVEMKPE